MAEFCSTCTVDQFGVTPAEAAERGDFVGIVSSYLTPGDIAEWPWFFSVCDGCGQHAFGNQGERLCDSDPPDATGPAPHAVGTECGTCSKIATAGAIAKLRATFGNQ